MAKRASFGWLELLLSALLVSLGIYTFVNLNAGFGDIAVAYGIAAILVGTIDVVLFVRMDCRIAFVPEFSAIAGEVCALCGILVLIGLSANILIPISFIAHCVSRLCNLGVTKLSCGAGAYIFSCFSGVLGIVLGGVLLLVPFSSPQVFIGLIGMYLVLLGAESGGAALFKKARLALAQPLEAAEAADPEAQPAGELARERVSAARRIGEANQRINFQ